VGADVSESSNGEVEDDYEPVPWHLKLLLLALVLYLGYRLVQLIIWLAERIF